nr:response regulator [Sinorhizobium meliloti]
MRGQIVDKVTILIADDEALLLIDFEQALVEAGFHVVAVTSGGKALEILNTAGSPIQGLVTDIRFVGSPEGWEVARIAREIDGELPVVYVSGDSAPDWASKGVPNSIMLEKPFAMAQLVTAIAQLLNDRRTGR